MKRSLRPLQLFMCFALPAALSCCGSSSDSTPPVPHDAGPPDTPQTDTSPEAPGADTIASDTTPNDTSVGDTIASDTTPSDSPSVDAPEGGVSTLIAAVDKQRYLDDLNAVTGERPAGAPHWLQVQDLCAQRLSSLGYTVEHHTYATGVNVVGVRTGLSKPTERVIVSAHYDSVPSCPAADDNATGVAGALEVARVLSTAAFARTLVVACWDEEEKGLVGSKAYATRAKGAGDSIAAVFVFEMIGFRSTAPNSQTFPSGLEQLFPTQVGQISANQSRGDFIALIHDEASASAAAAIVSYGQQLGLPTVALPVPENLKNNSAINALRRSDHASFWGVDYPGLMLGDTAEFRNTHYHCQDGPDVVADLDLDFATMVVKATVGAAAEALQPQ